MTAIQAIYSFTWNPSGASTVTEVAIVSANQHVRHVRLDLSATYVSQPTNVIGDYALLVGVIATYPAVAPPVPSQANSGSWHDGWWGRTTWESTDRVVFDPATSNGWRDHAVIEFDWASDANGTAGGIYVGTQALYVDANHSTPVVGATFTAWGWSD